MPRIKNQYLAPRKSILQLIKSIFFNSTKYQIPPAQNCAPSIIFDLDGVLCRTNTLQAFREIGIFITLKYIIFQRSFPSQKEFYKIIMATPAKSSTISYTTSKNRMPQILVDWQCDLQSTQQIQAAMIEHINQSKLTSLQKQFWIQTVLLTTTPEKLIASRCTIPGAVQLLQDIKAANYQLYVISNWDGASFPLFKKQFPQIFTYHGKKMFEGIVTSGKAGILKPHHKIFEKSLTEFVIQASSAIFIDDVLENVQAAQKSGMRTIHCINFNIKQVRTDLIKLLKTRLNS